MSKGGETVVIRTHGQGQSIPDDLLKRAQMGDPQSREVIIETMQPYIVRIASNYCGRYLHTGTDEEISVAMLALNEAIDGYRSEEHTSELQSRPHLVCRLLLEKKKKKHT